MMMIKRIVWIGLCVMALPALAHQFVAQHDEQPQTLQRHSIEIINFWATWCVPCRKEMPQMSRWYAQKGQTQKVYMVGIALDNRENVNRFLNETPVAYPIWRYIGHNSRAMMKEFGNQVGALPYTVVRMAGCEHKIAILGEVNEAKLDKALADIRYQCKKR